MHESNLTAYLYPNDSLEVERLDTQYNILKILLDGRGCLSPFTQANPPHKVLDIATGSGCWAIDMGDEFPEARIIGTDLSPIQTDLVPPNVEFIIDDAYVSLSIVRQMRILTIIGPMNGLRGEIGVILI
jgi:hypothetical protein